MISDAPIKRLVVSVQLFLKHITDNVLMMSFFVIKTSLIAFMIPIIIEKMFISLKESEITR